MLARSAPPGPRSFDPGPSHHDARGPTLSVCCAPLLRAAIRLLLPTRKKGLGKLLGDEQLEAEGRAKEVRGKVQQEDAKADERAKGALEEAAGAIKNRVGKLIDNEQMAAEGKAKELQGENRQKANQ
ncbi:MULTISPECIES: CsbD family protein [Sorangium]|uniref:CsbD family protein n=1 Tax=Sorangium TaxID=39643 RepID=UPI003D9C3494